MKMKAQTPVYVETDSQFGNGTVFAWSELHHLLLIPKHLLTKPTLDDPEITVIASNGAKIMASDPIILNDADVAIYRLPASEMESEKAWSLPENYLSILKHCYTGDVFKVDASGSLSFISSNIVRKGNDAIKVSPNKGEQIMKGFSGCGYYGKVNSETHLLGMVIEVKDNIATVIKLDDLDKLIGRDMVFMKPSKPIGSTLLATGALKRIVPDSKLSPFFFGNTEVTVRDFSEFVASDGYKTTAEKYTPLGSRAFNLEESVFEIKEGIDWRYDPTGRKLTSDEYDMPVVHISWYDAIMYCNWRSKHDGFGQAYRITDDLRVTLLPKANGYRLPTEEEWEYVARGKSQNDIWAGTNSIENLKYYANFIGDEDSYMFLAPVGKLFVNEFLIADLSGNVREWCWDQYIDDSQCSTESDKSLTKTVMPHENYCRAIRGGSWHQNPIKHQVDKRSGLRALDRTGYMGFRLARSIPN